MSHDVFVSYSHNDKAVADAACATLEREGVRCWIAPRDINPGAEWGGAIVEAINHCRVMVLIFSASANDSPQIRREVERAVNKEVPVLPFRIQDVQPTQSLEYFIGTLHWLDALTPPVEAHLARLADTVKALMKVPPLSSDPSDAVPRPAPPPPVTMTPHRRANLPMWIVAGCAVIAIALLGWRLATRDTSTPLLPPPPPDMQGHAGIVPHPQSASFAVSKWSGQYSYPGSGTPPVSFEMTLTIKGDGSFTGRSTEPATFGNRSSPVLTADISGQILETSVTFNKHYDGTGGVSTTIQYQGIIDPERTAMSGNWHASGAEGTFTANIREPDDRTGP